MELGPAWIFILLFKVIICCLQQSGRNMFRNNISVITERPETRRQRKKMAGKTCS